MRRLATVALVVPDYDEALAFYIDVMGFDLIEDRELGGGKRWLVVSPGTGGTEILIARAVNERQRQAIGNQTGGRVFLFLETEDFDADHARMVASGVAFEEEPRDEAYGRVAVFSDPFGNRWDLLQRRRDTVAGSGSRQATLSSRT